MGVEEWLVRGRREMRPLLLKMGVAVSLSVAGYLYSHLRSRPDRRSLIRQHPHTAPGVEGGREPCGSGLKDEILFLQCEDARSNVTNGATGIKVAAACMADHLSPHSKGWGDEEEEEERLLSEFNALVLQEFESVGRLDMVAMEPPPLKRSASDYKNGPADIIVAEQEVVLLKNLVRSLQERERSPEIRLLEYYGLREQESVAAVELEGRLKISAAETDFLSLRIESLQADNRRLAAQVADHLETKAELESTRAKVKHLKRKLKSESLQAKERIAVLQRRIAALQDMERRWGEAAEEAERRLTRVKDLEGEVAELRKANSKLAMANSDMTKKLESTQNLASSGLPFAEATKAAMEESNSLRRKNEELTEKLEQLQTDHCTNVEELVYLRWVNACLRYELRNYQPPPGKTAARDLSRTLSPVSEHKVKQLILEYANSGDDEKSISMTDFDSETCSSSQASSGDPEDAVVEVSSTPTKSGGGSSGKKKFFTKLKRLVLGKENKRQSKFKSPVGGSPTVSCGNSAARASASACSFDEMLVAVDRTSCDSAGSCNAPDHAKADINGQQDGGSPWTRDLSRVSVNFQRLRVHEELGERCRSTDAEVSKVDAGAAPCEKAQLGSSPRGAARPGKETSNGDHTGTLEEAMGKHVRAVRSPHGKPKVHLRSASFSFC